MLGNDGYTIAGLLEEEGRLQTSNASSIEEISLVEKHTDLTKGRYPITTMCLGLEVWEGMLLV